MTSGEEAATLPGCFGLLEADMSGLLALALAFAFGGGVPFKARNMAVSSLMTFTNIDTLHLHTARSTQSEAS